MCLWGVKEWSKCHLEKAVQDASGMDVSMGQESERDGEGEVKEGINEHLSQSMPWVLTRSELLCRTQGP